MRSSHDRKGKHVGQRQERDSIRRKNDRNGGTSGPPVRRQVTVGASVVALALALLIGVGLIGVALNVPYRVFTREVAEQWGAPSYTGFIAHITWFLWVVAATAGLLAAAVLRQRAHGDRRISFFLGASLLTSLLLLDDFLMLHERELRQLGVPQVGLYALYAAILVVLLLQYRRQFVGGGVLLALSAAVFWAASVAIDLVQERWNIHALSLEDGAKLIGTALWAAFMVWSNISAVGGGSSQPAAADTAVATRAPEAGPP